jgi:hypothetical protein
MKKQLGFFRSLPLAILLLVGHGSAASAAFSTKAPPVIGQSCTIVMSGMDEISYDFDKLFSILGKGLAGKGYQPYVLFDSSLPFPPTESAAEAQHPELFEYGTMSLGLDNVTPLNPRHASCPANTQMVGLFLHPDASYLGKGESYQEVFRDARGNFHEADDNFVAYDCLSQQATKAEVAAKREELARQLLAKFPTCEQWWSDNASNFNQAVIHAGSAGLSFEKVISCHSTDKLDALEFNFYSSVLAAPSSSLVAEIRANGKVVATTASIPEMSFSLLGDKQAQLYFPFGYAALPDGKHSWGSSSIFFAYPLAGTESATYQEQLENESTPWPGTYRDRKVECSFALDKLHLE